MLPLVWPCGRVMLYLVIIKNNKHMKKIKFECIKGIADSENINVIVMQGDIVIVNEVDEGDILVEGYAGWCEGVELNFTPKQFTECFKVIGLKYSL